MPEAWEMDWGPDAGTAKATAEAAPPWEHYQREELVKEQKSIRRGALVNRALLGATEGSEYVMDAASKILTAFPRAAYALDQMLGLTRPDISYEDAGYWSEGKPIITGDIITEPARGNNAVGQAMTGASKAALDVAGFFTTPEGVATAGAGGAGQLGKAALTTIFAGLMAHGLPDASGKYAEEMQKIEQQLANGEKPDYTEFARATANLGATGYFIGHPVAEGARAELPARWNDALETPAHNTAPWDLYARAEAAYPGHRETVLPGARAAEPAVSPEVQEKAPDLATGGRSEVSSDTQQLAPSQSSERFNPQPLPAEGPKSPQPAEPVKPAPIPPEPTVIVDPVDKPLPPAEPLKEPNEPGLTPTNPPGMDVRERAGAGPPASAIEQAPAPSGINLPDSPAGRGPDEAGGNERGRGVSGGDGNRAGASGRPGVRRQPAGAAPVAGAGEDLQKPGVESGYVRPPDIPQEVPKPLTVDDANHVLPAGEDWIPSGDKAKASANLDAIKLLKQLEIENRQATPEEKATLAKYTGWGGLKPIFDSGKAAYRERAPWGEEQKKEAVNWEKQWGKLYDEVKGVLTPEEHSTAARSILNAHYTARNVINGVWAAVQRLGFRGGKVLEPAMGIGHFVGLTPENLRGKVKWSGVELDSVSARIAARLYPQARVQGVGFEEARFAPNSQDLVISNVPFAQGGPIDKRYPKLSLHNYFFARALDVVKPGGLVAFITSDSTMDGPRAAREYFAEKADLVGAIRLPNNAFKKNAGTEVTTDVLFFRKRDASPFVGQPFKATVPSETYKGQPIEINEYFAQHPDMMLGRMSLEGTMYGPDQQALLPTPGADLDAQMAEAITKLPENVMGSTLPDPGAVHEAPVAEGAAKIGQLRVKDGNAYQVQPDGSMEKTEWSGDRKKVAQATGYIEMVDHTKGHVARMLDPNATEADIVQSRKDLNRLYDAYHKKYGAINERRSGFLDDDVEFPLALALEDGVSSLVELPGGKTKRETAWVKGKMFSERTIFPRLPPSRVDSVSDGLQVSQNFAGRVDPDYIAKLTGKSVEAVQAELMTSGQAYENPSTGGWESRSTYLSGFVKKKLEAARAAAESDPKYAKQVAELEAVQPPDIAIENIGVKLGSVFVPPSVIEAFLKDRIDVSASVNFTPETGQWSIAPRAGAHSEKNRTIYGIHDWKGHELVEQSLNLKSANVTKLVPKDGGGTSEVKDGPKSLEAQQRQEQLQKEFKEYVKTRPDAARLIEKIYNDRYNGVVAPKFDAPTWAHYPGASADIQLYDHQKAVVSRMLQNSTLLAHAVGTGKTFAMTTAAMEMRRLGLAKKPMIVVQNATLEQFASSFKKLYPTARILSPNAKMRDAQNRNKTMSRIATGDWDAVIIPQSFVNMLPDNPERESGYIRDRLSELESAKIEAAAAEGKKSPKASDIQKAMDRLQKRLDEMANRQQDNVLTFEQLGVDALFVDEAHAYKKLEFSTQMDSIKGLDKGASQRGWSMSMKTRWVQEKNQGRNVIFATGTPVSNTIAEAWNMMRYVRPDVLKAYGIEKFDEFASTFGDTVTQLEMTPGGTWKPVTRFARFTNGPELIAAWRTVADVVTPEEINLPGLPALKNGRPDVHVIKQSPELKNYVTYLRSELERFAAMSGRDKRDNSHIPLVVFGLAKKASLDMRMIDPTLPDQPGSKLHMAADAVAQIYRDSTSVKGTQMIFSDSFQDNPDTPRFNLYQEMKKKLVERGVPEEQIVIITADIKDAKREALFSKLNEGDLRIVLGSTERMGVGVNAQKHMIGLHHLDAPARPMDIEQRNGRIIRQKNQNPIVEVHSYGVENTLDAAMFQKLATKQKFINQILRGDLQGRNFEDAANEQSLTFEEQMAAFSGDKRAMEKVGLENSVRQMEMLKSGHFEQVRKARNTIENLNTRTIPFQTSQAAEAIRRAKVYDEAFGGGQDYTLKAGGKEVSGRKEVAAALDAHFKEIIAQGMEQAKKQALFRSVEIPAGDITLNGQKIELAAILKVDSKGVLEPESAAVGWKFVDGGAGGQSSTGAGFYHSLAASLERIAAEPDFYSRSVANEKRNVAELSGFVQQPFEREAELADSKNKLAALTAELAAEGAAPRTGPPPTSPDAEDAASSEVEHGFSGNTTLVQAAVNDLARIRNLVAPQTAGGTEGAARFAGNLLRQLNARMANEMARADSGLARFRRDFDRTPINLKKFKYDPTLPLPRNLAFIDAYETGNTASMSRNDALAAAEFHRLNAADLARVHALGTGALTTFYANYFPHMWENPRLAASVFAKLMAKSPLEGSKGFLKQRTHQLFREGLAAGLIPVHDNPIDLWLLKKREVERYILAKDFMSEMKAEGLLKFKYVFGKPVDGWSTVNDHAFTQYGPPTVTIKEAFDAGMRSATLDLLQTLGVPHERLARIGGQRWGYERETPGVPGTERIVTKFGGHDEVMWHELGHVLHNRYSDLETALTFTDQLKVELRNLADARLDPANTSATARRNVRSMPEKMAVVAQAYIHAPELMAQIAPTVKTAFENFIKAHPELEPINDINPSLRLGVGVAEMPHGGLLKLGDYIVPDGAAKVINNFLSPGLNTHLWYRTLRQVSNLLNGVQLGLSGFHLGFTSLDASVSRMSVGIEDAYAGKPIKALGTILSSPLAGIPLPIPGTNLRQGARLKAEVLRPGAYPALAELGRALEAAGGRVGQDAFWKTEFTRRMVRAWHAGGLQYGKAVGLAPFALWEQSMRPIMEYVVPRQKLGVFADMAKRELIKLGPSPDPAQYREAMRKAWDSVDNRMGQVVYDNLYYNRSVKDVALLTFRAYGWQLGKYREGTGAIVDSLRAAGKVVRGERPELTHRMAYAVALPLMVGAIGGMLHYLMNGTPPQDPKDYFMPRTGEKDRNGNDVRLNLPSYIKDVIATSKHPITTLGHSLNPLLAGMADLLQNKDFYDTEIRHPDDPLWKQGSDVAKFVGEQFVPFSVSGARQLQANDAPAWKLVAPFFGVTPVASRILMTPAQEAASEIMAAASAGTRTREQSDQAQAIRDIIKQMKTDRQGGVDKLADGIDKGTLNPNAAVMLLQRLHYDTLQFQVHHMTPDAAMKVWRLATPEEKERLWPIVSTKIAHAESLPEGRKRIYMQEMQDAMP